MKNKIIKAENGKVFRRIADGQIYGREISLGYTYYIGGKKLIVPHLDVPEDFEQIYEPVRENINKIPENVNKTPSETVVETTTKKEEENTVSGGNNGLYDIVLPS